MIPTGRRTESFADDLNTRRGIVSGRVALLPRSTEIQPFVAPIRPSPLRHTSPKSNFVDVRPEVRSERPPEAARLGFPLRCPGETCSDRKSTRLNSSHVRISYAVFCLKKKTKRTRD